MYLRGYYKQPNPGEQYSGLKLDSKFLFPYWVRYIAWSLIAATVISSSTVLIYYGMSFGMTKIYLWATSLIFSVVISAIFFPPIKIFFFILIESFSKKKPIVIKRRIPRSFLSNPYNAHLKKHVMQCRKYNRNLYAPTPLSKLQGRLEDIKYNIELRNLTMDIVSHIAFTLVVFYIILLNKTEMGYYSTEVIKSLVLRGDYTDSIPFAQAITYERFLEYINKTLLPALLLNSTDYTADHGGSNKSKRWTEEYHERTDLQNDNIKKRQIQNNFNNLRAGDFRKKAFNVFQKGWTLDPAVKLLGKPRFRQVRVKTETCKEPFNLKPRNAECASDLTLFNVETRNFTLYWHPGPSKGTTTAQEIPWTYQSVWETESLPISRRYTIYPGGGYILNLARNINDARIVFDFLHEFQWIDVRTRAVFIEFALYCVNTNLFNVVTLIAERTSLGYFIPSYEIQTCKFIFTRIELEIIFIIMSTLMVLLLLLFIIRESLRIHRISIATYLTRGVTLLDLAIIVLGLLNVVFLILRSVYVSRLMKKLEESDNNEFVNFTYAAAWYTCSIYAEGILECLALLKLFRLLSFRVVFFKFKTLLAQCYKHFINLFIMTMLIILAFSFLFHLTFLNYIYEFSYFDISFLTLIHRAVIFENRFDYSLFNSSSWYMGPFFMGLFIAIINVLFINLLTPIVKLYFSQVHKIPLVEKYDLFEYLKHKLVPGRRRDILKLKEKNLFPEENPDPDVMRLKGGGKKSAKEKKKEMKNRVKEIKCLCKSAHKKLKKKKIKEETGKVKLCELVTKKSLDTTKYQDLAVERALAMKHLVLSVLAKTEETKRCARETALKALFCSLTDTRRKYTKTNSIQGPYFLDDCKRVYDGNRFLKMQKVIEDTARENCWLEEEEKSFEENPNAKKDKLSVLNKKLGLLMRKKFR